MRRLLAAASALAFLALAGPAAATQVQTTPTGYPSTDLSGTVTAGTTYQTVQAATAGRHGCLIQNTSTHAETVRVNSTVLYSLAPASGTGDGFAPGGSFNCQYGGLVITDKIEITSPTTGAAFTAAFQ